MSQSTIVSPLSTTIISPVTVELWVESAKRYPLAGSDIKARFLALAASHEQLRANDVARQRVIRELEDQLSSVKAALKAKGGRKR
jgi:hypothetical protein